MRGHKSKDAYRTISEVADMLKVKPHVLRFWEKKFIQIKPLKRESGRRYYRPEDVQIISQIKDLLYDQGYTVRGVQQLLKQKGVKVFQLRDETLEFATMFVNKETTDSKSDERSDANDSPSNSPSNSLGAQAMKIDANMEAKLRKLQADIRECLYNIEQNSAP